MTNEIINFGAGPAKLPPQVLCEVQKELLNYNDTGMSVMETSHRSSTYNQIHNNAILALKEILNIPENYKVLFMHGGGVGLFSAIALNLLPRTGEADYIVTGTWSKLAAEEAKKFGQINYVIPDLPKGSNIPEQSTWKLSKNASYLYYCANETVSGFEFPFIPKSDDSVPLVCDMSSNILTKEIDVSKYGLIFAGAQKNVGPAGVAIVIIRDDLITEQKPSCPAILDFFAVAKANSVLNTPPTFTIYVCGKVLDYLKQMGGIQVLCKLSKIKSEILYNLIDDSDGFYINEIHPACRSRINITFRIKGGPEMEDKFVKSAAQAGLVSLKGHRSVGGIRASLYNAVTVEDTAKLAGFMRLFMNENAFK